jgi:ketosteroid isomerase-like protein
MDQHPNASLIREMFDAMQRGDTAWMDQHVADDIVWHVGGNSRSAGVFRGKETVAQMMAGVTDPQSMKVDTHDIIAGDDHTVVLGTAVVTAPSGASAEYNFVNVFHIANGKLTEVWGMSENDAITDPIWDEFALSDG